MYVSFQSAIRQPFFPITTVVAYIFILSTPAFTMFTLMNAKKLVLDMSMATILMVELAVSILATSSIVAGEVEEKTTTLLLSKPVSRLTFLLAKFSAIALALLFVLLPLVCVLIMTLRMGVPEAAYSEVKYPILWFAFLPLIGAVIVSAGANYYADKNFASTFVISLNIFVLIALLLLYLIEKNSLMINLFYPAFFLWMAGVVISPVASVFSLGGRIFFTLIFSFLIFILGLTTNYLLGNILHLPGIALLYSLIPNFQVFWVEDSWVKGKAIPISYLWSVVRYVFLYCMAMLLLGWSLWERREIS